MWNIYYYRTKKHNVIYAGIIFSYCLFLLILTELRALATFSPRIQQKYILMTVLFCTNIGVFPKNDFILFWLHFKGEVSIFTSKSLRTKCWHDLDRLRCCSPARQEMQKTRQLYDWAILPAVGFRDFIHKVLARRCHIKLPGIIKISQRGRSILYSFGVQSKHARGELS